MIVCFRWTEKSRCRVEETFWLTALVIVVYCLFFRIASINARIFRNVHIILFLSK